MGDKNVLLLGFEPATAAFIERLLTVAGHRAAIKEREAIHPDLFIGAQIMLLPAANTEVWKSVEGVPYIPKVAIALHHGDEMPEIAQDMLPLDSCTPALLAKSMQYATAMKYGENGKKYFFDDRPGPLYIYDAETYQMMAMNNDAQRQYGYTREEAENITALDIRPEEDRDAFMERQAYVMSNYYDAGEWRHRRSNGEIFHVHLFAQGMMFNGRRAVMVNAVDITEKVLANRKNDMLQAELRRQKAHLDRILSSIPEVVWSRRADDFTLVYINDACERIYGYTADELMGTQGVLTDGIHPEDRGAMQQVMDTIRDTGRAELEYRIINRDGSIKTLFNEAVLVKGDDTNPDMIVGVAVDLTAQTQLQRIVEKEKNHLRAIINNTKDIVWSIDRDMNILGGNYAFWIRIEELTGKQPKEILENDYSKELFDEWQHYFNQAFEQGGFSVVTEEIRNGKLCVEEVSFSQITEEDGTISGLSCASHDITDTYHYTREIEAQNKKLKEIALWQSHQVRGPLASIMGLIQLFDNNDLCNVINAKLIRDIQQVAEEMDENIRHISDVASGK
ncbi:MAG: PAS domain S-box protein [Sphingobacteriales bacterium]|nr:MAG: PAS domain S-box protein [Sphingobacteriales bacterium]